jgi:hypothetical protein
MTQPVDQNTKLVDREQNGQIADRGASVAVPVDLATSIVAITAIIERLEAHGLIAEN